MKIKILKILWLFVFCLAANNCCVSSDSDRIAKRLKSLEHTLPLPYHERLDKAVQAYSAKALPDAFVVSEPFLDSALSQHGMPKEMKYLPLALSGMRTDYANNDRCGVWSLPSLVAMRYGLAVDDKRDERFAILIGGTPSWPIPTVPTHCITPLTATAKTSNSGTSTKAICFPTPASSPT